jgi:O-antigen/teichoic acid export membrane protein
MSLTKNVVANYIGQGWVALTGIVFIPLYVRVLGIETYGLISVFALLQAWMALLDFGLTPTLNREMARLSAGAHTARSIRELLRVLEVIYLAIAAMVILGVWFAAPWLASGWLKVERLPIHLVTESIRIMAFVLAIRWVEQVYRGALQGRQDLIWLNSRQAVLATIRWGGAYAMIALVSPTIRAFFVWQGIASILSTGLFIRRTYRMLPPHAGPTHFRLAALRDIRAFASGMFLSSILGFLLTQTDKLVVSKMLPLAQLGHYMLASTAVSGLLQLIAPMNTAVYPRLTEQVVRQDQRGLARTYHTACQWMAAIMVPSGLLLTFFAEPVMLFWTGDPVLTHAVAPILEVLALGTVCYAFMNLPYTLQLAHGWTSLAVRINIVAVSVIVPVIVWVVPRYGATGAAYGWLLLNCGYLVVNAHLMHRRLLQEWKWAWYREAVALPLVAGGLVCVGIRLLWPTPTSRSSAALVLVTTGIALCGAMVAVLPAVRETVIRAIVRARISTA